MSTLTRTNNSSSHNNRNPKYKDYMSFVDSYRFGKKDDQNSVITTSDSGVSFSLNSSANNSSSSIYSDMSSDGINNSNNNNKKIVKSEVFIEIKNPSTAAPSQFPTQVFKLEVVPPAQQKVSNTAKIFEANKLEKTFSASKPNMRQNSIDQLSKKFEPSTTTHVDGNINGLIITNKPPLKRAESIGKVSKIFEQQSLELNRPSSTVISKTKNFNAVPKPFPAKSSSAKPAISPKPLITTSTSVFSKFSSPSSSSETVSNYADSVDSALSSLSVSPSPPQCVSPQPLQFRELPPPPPPPLPPMNFSAPISKSNNIPKQIPVQTTPNNYNNNTIIDKNDPRVKKAVYGALRNMYGAYHDQANDYLATLPKNRVRKNNGLDSIIDSIASQGGLGKLNGRVNPKQELE